VTTREEIRALRPGWAVRFEDRMSFTDPKKMVWAAGRVTEVVEGSQGPVAIVAVGGKGLRFLDCSKKLEVTSKGEADEA